jgi:hypothetical protein
MNSRRITCVRATYTSTILVHLRRAGSIATRALQRALGQKGRGDPFGKESSPQRGARYPDPSAEELQPLAPQRWPKVSKQPEPNASAG